MFELGISKKGEIVIFNRRLLIVLLGISMLLVVSACGDKEEEEEKPQEIESVEISEEELVDKDEVVATVNETEILGSEYNPAYRERKEMESFTIEPGEEIDTENVKEVTLTGLVDQELINQEIEKLDIKVTDEEVEKELELLKAEEDGKALDSLLEQFEWTEEDLKEQIEQDLTNNRYIEETIDVKEVTDEEAKEEYDRVKAEAEDKETVPEYAEVQENIKLQMTQEKQNKELQKKLDKFEEKAEIEILI